MKHDFVAEILRATGTLRSGGPAGAADIIQAALAAGGLSSGPPPAAARTLGAAKLPNAAISQGPLADGRHVEQELGAAGLGLRSQERPRIERLRRPIGEVLRTLREGRKSFGLQAKMPGLQPQQRTPNVSVPEGAEFRDLTHSCAAGARRYRLYVPASAGAGLQGLLVMLHGCTQSPEDFAAGTGMNALAEEHRLLIAYPAQTRVENSMSCWNWFRPGDQMRNIGEPAIIAGLTESLRDEFGIAHDRVFVAGLSAGGAMAAIMLETYPELYSAAGIHSGLAYGSANDVVSAFAAMRGQNPIRPIRDRDRPSRVIVFHGSADATVHPSNAGRIVVGLRGAPARVETQKHPSSGSSRGFSRTVAKRDDGRTAYETWIIDGAPHAWSGGNSSGSYTDPAGPNASAEMVRFFLE